MHMSLNPAEEKTQSLSCSLLPVAFITASFPCSLVTSISPSSDDLLAHVGRCLCVCVFAIISQTNLWFSGLTLKNRGKMRLSDLCCLLCTLSWTSLLKWTQNFISKSNNSSCLFPSLYSPSLSVSQFLSLSGLKQHTEATNFLLHI